MARSPGLRLHDLALLRAVVQGMRPAAAARRYLPDLHRDARVVRSHLVAVAREARIHLEGMGEANLAAALGPALGLNMTEPEVGQGAPDLEEFARRFDVGMFSERELVELYEEEYGACAIPEPPAFGPTPAQALERALKGLSLIQARGVQVPKGDDPVSLWLSARLCAQLRPFGVLRLSDLVTLANRFGRTWWREVPGLGRERAERLVQWLLDHETWLGQRLSPRVRREAVAVVATTQPGARLPAMAGHTDLRSTGFNALGANSDHQALRIWLDTLSLKSPHTLAAYRRDVERLLLWAHERGLSLSTLTVVDAIEHARFLSNPPAHWVNTLPATRCGGDWRPMRGPLSRSSARRALAAIGHLYGFLVESGYLTANPFARVRAAAGASMANAVMDTTRSFGLRHLDAMRATLDAMPGGAHKRRLLAILMLAETTGMRRQEMSAHTWGDLRKHAGETTGARYVLTVRGKGGHERKLPVKDSVIEALERHLADRRMLMDAGVLPDQALAETPLISVLEQPPVGALHACSGALSEAGLHRVLKRFFQSVADHLAGLGLPETADLQEDFARASCHWLRHTFAHEILKASGADLPVTQQLLGHKNISTTGIYLKADMGQRIDAVVALPDRFC
ncbi:MAG: tyrosine-type recombinase/integrase [Proteobacteria bacterium]|nr:tyrosine-type recombinase/integrase [Pseudomonadota bacterium]